MRTINHGTINLLAGFAIGLIGAGNSDILQRSRWKNLRSGLARLWMEEHKMEKISIIMMADNEGKITVKNVLEYIRQNVPKIKVPDGDLSKIPLAALMLTDDITKHCTDGYASGLKWNNGKFIEYEFTLIFK